MQEKGRGFHVMSCAHLHLYFAFGEITVSYFAVGEIHRPSESLLN